MFLLLLIINVFGHGRLVKPIPYFGAGSNNGNENAPVSGASGADFVCRHTTNSQASIQMTAGQTLNLQWDFSAAHKGDCALYASYDVDVDRTAQKYFKIANFPKCNLQNRQDVPITIPEWLPAGPIVFRWDWYALHTYPGAPEFYAQCFDGVITATAAAVPKDDIFTYTIPGLYPATINEGVGYRNPNNPSVEPYLTGPPCALNWNGNNCDLTACGNTGFIDVKNAYTGTGRRRLCADISANCLSESQTWDICSSPWWNSQCQKFCNECSDDNGNGGDTQATGIESTTGTETTTTPADGVLPAGCEAYAYDFNQGGEGNGQEGSDPDASAALSLIFLLLSLLVIF